MLNLVASRMEEADEALRGFTERIERWREELGEVEHAEGEVGRVGRERDGL